MDENKSVTSFRISGEYFAFETEAIRHILERVPATRVPLTKPFVKGIINNHGNMVPVVDLRILIGKEPDDSLPEQCIVIVGIVDNGGEEQVGFIVDEMDDVFEFEPSMFNPEVVIDINPNVQKSLSGTISIAGKFVFLFKTSELAKALE